jgi:uncharacterized protein DUF4395
MSSAIIKPVPGQTNESKVRLTAFFVLLLALVYLLTNSIAVPVILVIDFALRSFNLGKFSPLAFISEDLVRIFKLPFKAVYMPPKRFAARIGLVFSIAILILHLLGHPAIIVTAVLVFFAALESLLGFCAGCYVYNFLQKFRKAN